jgi:hypothetical protein
MGTNSAANHENKGCGLGLTWAGTEARPTEEKGFFWKPETGNWKPETGNHPGMPALQPPLSPLTSHF